MNQDIAGLYEKGRAIAKYLTRKKISTHSASACFFIVLAFFPTLVLLLGLVRYTGFSVDALTELLEGLIPEALLPTAKKLIVSTYRNATGTMVSLTALAALWSASRGIHGVRSGLNSIYEVAENRGYFYTRIMSIFYTLAFFMVLMLTLVFHVFGKSVSRWLLDMGTPVFRLLAFVLNMRFFILLILQTVLFTAMYMFLPNRHNGFWESVPGALFSAVGWLLTSQLYSVYVNNFNAYANIYGSVYAVALCMLWLYLCLEILFCGGALNGYLSKKP